MHIPKGNLFNTIWFPQPFLSYYISTDSNCSEARGEPAHVPPPRTAHVHYKNTDISPPGGAVDPGTSGSPYPRAVAAGGGGGTCTRLHYTAAGEGTDTPLRRVSAAGEDNDGRRSPVVASADEANISRRGGAAAAAAAVDAAGGAGGDIHKASAGGTDPAPSPARVAAGGAAARGR